MLRIPRFINQGDADFSTAQKASHAVINEEYGKTFTHLPMKKVVNKSPVRDRSRAVQENLLGIFDWEAKDVRLALSESKIDSRDPQVTFRRCDLRFPIYAGDLLKCWDEDLVFEVTQTKPDSEGGLVCELLQMGVTDQ